MKYFKNLARIQSNFFFFFQINFQDSYMRILSLFQVKTLFTMATKTAQSGIHSMAFVTAPSEDVAKKIARLLFLI